MSITLLLECNDNGTMRRFIERLLRDITRLGNFGSSTKDLSGNVVQYREVSSSNGHDRAPADAISTKAVHMSTKPLILGYSLHHPTSPYLQWRGLNLLQKAQNGAYGRSGAEQGFSHYGTKDRYHFRREEQNERIV
jgi:hypothetical protein